MSSSYPFKIELTKTLEQLISIYESQIVNKGNSEYISALAELIAKKYWENGISDYEIPTDPSGEIDVLNEPNAIDQAYRMFEVKVELIIKHHRENIPWVPDVKNNQKAYRN